MIKEKIIESALRIYKKLEDTDPIIKSKVQSGLIDLQKDLLQFDDRNREVLLDIDKNLDDYMLESEPLTIEKLKTVNIDGPILSFIKTFYVEYEGQILEYWRTEEDYGDLYLSELPAAIQTINGPLVLETLMKDIYMTVMPSTYIFLGGPIFIKRLYLVPSSSKKVQIKIYSHENEKNKLIFYRSGQFPRREGLIMEVNAYSESGTIIVYASGFYKNIVIIYSPIDTVTGKSPI